MKNRTYLCIDLKSFYASVECVERGLDPMTANLVVADMERTDKTICLAVSPSLKKLGVKNRCRVFEIPKNIDYIAAAPRMQKYIDYAAEIYGVYLEHISPDDIHVYSIDEAFLDITGYLDKYGKTAVEMAKFLMGEITNKVGVRAAAGIGSNLYLAKIALDITAKRSPDFIGVLDEQSYREQLWDHRPLTDFWRVGRGIAARLEKLGIYTMGDIARAGEDLLYKRFGVDAELLIDHAWGREPTTIADIKAYSPKSRCLSSGQVLMRDYSFDEARIIVQEMTDQICLDLVEKGLLASSIWLMVGYSNALHCEPSSASFTLARPTNADSVLIPAAVGLYKQIADTGKPVRRIHMGCSLEDEGSQKQLSLFDDDGADTEKNRELQKTIIDLKRRFGKDAVLKGMDLTEAGTTRQRNHQIGGHKSGE